MVVLRLLFIMMTLSLSSFADDVQVSASIESDQAYENYPLQGTVTVTHNPKDKIDASSFKMDGKPLESQLFKNVQLSPNTEIAFFHFTLPGKPKGLYLLSPIEVKVGQSVYQSLAISYEVIGAAKIVPSITTGPQTPAALELKAAVEAPKPFFPRQQAKLIYRYYFKGNIELSEEHLPLLDATGFEKVGDKVISNSQENGFNVQEISQTVQALNPGEYKFPASSAQGYAYVEDPILKTRTYLEPKLKTEVDPITITVLPFPAEGQPTTFTGAVGQYTFQVTLLTSPTVTVEDQMKIAIDISSPTSALSTINLPDLNQTGVKGLFRLSDLPPVGQIQNHTIRFVEELYPLLTGIKEIPSIEFSFFDPQTAKYVILKSDPISITVQPRAQPGQTPAAIQPAVHPALPATPSEQPTVVTPQLPANLQTPIPTPTPQVPLPIEIAGNYDLTEADLQNLPFGTWPGLLVIPTGIFLLLLQLFLRKRLLESLGKPRPETSKNVWRNALKQPYNSPEFYSLLERALMLHLVERKQIPNAEIDPEHLPEGGEAGKVRNFLLGMYEQRFAGKAEESRQKIVAEAKTLMKG